MPKRLAVMLLGANKNYIKELCEEKGLNSYETELMIRIYAERQSLNYIADTMRFDKYGRKQQYYSVRSINEFHRQAFIKLMLNQKEVKHNVKNSVSE